MKKPKEIKWFILFAFMLLAILSCEKNSSENVKSFLGTWVSTDLVDTLEFTTENDFYKNVSVPKDHFNYKVSADTISIQYNGFLKILVQPTNHFYKFNGDLLTINLENCYGFRNQTISFTRR
jgi:hypothetical protein